MKYCLRTDWCRFNGGRGSRFYSTLWRLPRERFGGTRARLPASTVLACIFPERSAALRGGFCFVRYFVKIVNGGPQKGNPHVIHDNRSKCQKAKIGIKLVAGAACISVRVVCAHGQRDRVWERQPYGRCHRGHCKGAGRSCGMACRIDISAV